jgi:cell division septal protein FtsQ
MRRWLLFLSVLGLAVVAASALSRIPRALAEVEAFEVTGIRLRGARFLTEEEAALALALAPGASVWDDTDPLEARLRTHPLVREVKIHRRFPSTLLLEVTEREPVALVATPTLEPVDDGGRILPIDPARHPLDLPVIASSERTEPSLTPAQRRILAGEIARLKADDPEFLAQLSHLSMDSRGHLVACAWEPSVDVHFRPGLPNQRIQQALRVLMDAQDRYVEKQVVALDLRYGDQVVVRLGRKEGN